MRPPVPRSIRGKPQLPDTDVLVVEILTFLGDDPERLDRFLALTGMAVGDLRHASTNPAFAESLLDHLCSDEQLLISFATPPGYDPASIERVRQSLAPPPFDS